MKIIDFHVHPYMTDPENLCMYKADFWLNPEEAAADMKRAGITHICGSVIEKGTYDAAKGFSEIQKLNDRALKMKEIYGDFYTPGFHIHPGYIKESMETLEFMHQNGYRLVGELVPNLHGWKELGMDYASKELQELLELVGEYDMIVNYHTMPDQQEQMEAMIARNPKVTFVAAHPGDRAHYPYHLERMKKYENAYLDISGTGLFRYGMLHEGIRQVGADKFLFGTDYPITNPGMYVEAVRFEHISDEDREKIFYKNAERLLFT